LKQVLFGNSESVLFFVGLFFDIFLQFVFETIIFSSAAVAAEAFAKITNALGE
jgi:hypothetical protein